MSARRLSFLLLLLLSLDFGTPFLGGAFTFEASAEGVHRRRESAPPAIQAGDLIDRPVGESVRLVSRSLEAGHHARREPPRWGLTLPRSRARADVPPATSEDH